MSASAPIPAIWAVGDSLTWGSGLPSTPGGWRSPVAAELDTPAGVGVRWVGSSIENPGRGAQDRRGDRHDGHPGWRADELAALDRPALRSGTAPDLVVLQAGTNDLIQRWAPGRAFHGRLDELDGAQREAFAADLVARLEMLVRAVADPGTPVVLWTIPPVDLGGPRHVSPSLPAVNARLAAAMPALHAEGRRVTAVDVHAALAPAGAVLPGLLGPDGVHPTPAGYREIARVLTPAIRAALG